MVYPSIPVSRGVSHLCEVVRTFGWHVLYVYVPVSILFPTCVVVVRGLWEERSQC